MSTEKPASPTITTARTAAPDVVDQAPAAGDTPPGGSAPRLEVQLIARALEHPRRNGLLIALGGMAVLVGVILFGVQTGRVLLYVGMAAPAASGIGLWLLAAPVPEGAAARLMGQLHGGGGAWWFLWQLGLGLGLFGGAALGWFIIHTLFTFA